MKMPPVLCCIVFLFVSMLSAVARQQEKPRVIVTTDGEIDDQSSMIRFLMYSSDYDVAGIVQVNGVQKDGHSKDKWIESQIAKYAECLPNLRKHNPDYPDAEYLLSVSWRLVMRTERTCINCLLYCLIARGHSSS